VEGELILIDDNAGSQIAASLDGGQSWSKADVGQIAQLALVGGQARAAGGTTGDGPKFYRGEAASMPLTLSAAAVSQEDNLQEARGMASPDQGQTWIIVGAYDDEGAWIKRSTDDGQAWADAEVDASQVAFFEDVVCVGSWCVAVGRRRSDDAGIAYESTDGGQRWRQRNIGEGVNPLYTAFAAQDRVWLAGDGEVLLALSAP
jgi:hypothetical protein